MGFYTIASALSPSYSLNLAATNPPVFSDGTNVNVTYTAVNNFQTKWYIPSIGNGVQVVSTANMRYRLGADPSSWNCNVRLKNYAAYINFKAVTGENNTYRLQMKDNPDMYLTLEKAELYANVKWAKLNTSNAGQKWVLREIECAYVYANDWLRMKTTPSAQKYNTVAIPTVASFTGEDGVLYKFTDKSYWASGEKLYATYKINGSAYTTIKNVTGVAPTINVGAIAGCTDEHGRYWIAVGPKVVYPSQSDYEEPLPKNMYAKGYLDVVVKNEYGTRFYVPCVVGDTKLHTWKNGVIQTWQSYPVPDQGITAGDFTPSGATKDNPFNGQVCAEFINAQDYSLTSTLRLLSIDYIRFYPS